MRAGVWDHPKLRRLARLAGCFPAEARGICTGLWAITALYKPRGDIGGLSDEEIADYIETSVPTERLLESLIASGLIDRHDKYRLVVHDWLDWCELYVIDKVHKRGEQLVDEEDGKVRASTRKEAAPRPVAERPEPRPRARQAGGSEITQHWCLEYERQMRVKYDFGKRDGVLLAALVKAHGEPTVKALIGHFLAEPADDFLTKSGYSVAAFRARFQGLLARHGNGAAARSYTPEQLRALDEENARREARAEAEHQAWLREQREKEGQ